MILYCWIYRNSLEGSSSPLNRSCRQEKNRRLTKEKKKGIIEAVLGRHSTRVEPLAHRNALVSLIQSWFVGRPLGKKKILILFFVNQLEYFISDEYLQSIICSIHIMKLFPNKTPIFVFSLSLIIIYPCSTPLRLSLLTFYAAFEILVFNFGIHCFIIRR